jgi:chemotaxis family two-component system response regulator Rcp1
MAAAPSGTTCNFTEALVGKVLAQIKKDESLKLIPVILTTSVAESDIAKGYQFKANCYLNKPVQLDDFEDLVKTINDFWLTRAQLPSARRRRHYVESKAAI